MRIFYFLLLAALLSGCYSRKKAQQQFGRSISTFPEIGAQFCATTYPVKAKTDSTEYHKSKSVIDSLSAALKADSLLTLSEREHLMQVIEQIRRSIPDPQNCDSLSEAIYRLAAKERQRGDYLQGVNNNLITAAKNIKPIRDTVVNTAEYEYWKIQANKAIDIATDKTKEADKWRHIAKKRFWIILGMGAAMAIGIFALIRRKIVKKIPT